MRSLFRQRSFHPESGWLLLAWFPAIRFWVGVGWAVALTLVACAHDPGLSTATGELRPREFRLSNGFSSADVRKLLPDDAPWPEKWNAVEFESAKPRLLALALRLWELRSDHISVTPQRSTLELLAGNDINFHLEYELSGLARNLTLETLGVGKLPRGHRQFIVITDAGGVTVAQKLLSAEDSVLSFSATGEAPAEQSRPGFWGFLKLGVAHIWTGYDHLLFLFALLVTCRTFRSIVTIVSCFTLAHSLTLGLATLNVVNLSPRWAEPAIAASIVFVGVENLLRRGTEPKGRGALTFAFGLVHGFGFASVLRDLGVGADGQGLALPLFSFNLGVEVGQVTVAGVVLPIVWRMRKNPRFVERGVPALSTVVVVLGLYWLLERTLFA